MEFKLEMIPPGSNILVVGRRGMGKTHLTCDLLTHRSNSVPVVFSSVYVAQRYRSHLPASNVVDSFDATKLKSLLDRQLSTGDDRELVIAFDDVSNGNECLMENSQVRELCMYGSSLNLTSVFAVQHAGVYDETFRRNVDYLFIFHDNLDDYQRVVYEKYARTFGTFSKFQAVYNECTTEPFRCLVIDMRTPWKGLGDGVYWYASPADLPRATDTIEQIRWDTPAREEPPTVPEQESKRTKRGVLKKLTHLTSE